MVNMSKRVLNSKFIISLFVCSVLFLPNISNASVSGGNAAAGVLCDVILLIRGRIGRALALIAIMSTAWGWVMGHSNWQRVSSLVVGFGLLFGAESFAYIILPSTVEGITGTTATGVIFSPNKKYAPTELVKSVCPELSRY